MDNNLIEILKKQMTGPQVSDRISYGRITISLMSNNTFMFSLDDHIINWAHSKAVLSDGRTISTATAKRMFYTVSKADGKAVLTIPYVQDDITLTQIIEIKEGNPYFTIEVKLSSKKEISSNWIAALDFPYPSAKADEMFLSLDEEMLLVPYDNDMWSHYEMVPLKCGRTSYDVTVIKRKGSPEGLLIGALDFDSWKNGIVCGSYDARVFSAVSGVADQSTHDCLPHGYLSGKTVSSSRFICGWFSDLRDALELYGRLTVNPEGLRWSHGVPFGWNSYSALTLKTTLDHYQNAADFIYYQLLNFKSQENTTYINLDAVFGIDPNRLKQIIDTLHSRNQKAGIYLAPLCHLPIMDSIPLLSDPDKTYRDIVLKKPDGTDYPPIDGKYPVDITLPEAERNLRMQLRMIVDMGFDYLKIDFLSHGSLEGQRHDPSIRTGRQALNHFYRIVMEEFDSNRIGRDIFVSLSIAPLYPCGFGHARRSCCDSFGHHEDVRYVLNSLTYSWWTSGNQYCYNDPDHTVLYRSEVDGRQPTLVTEAKSRYNASVISGTVMLLSDNYGPDEDSETVSKSRLRSKLLANNNRLNRLARLGKAFRPVSLEQTENVYYLKDNDKTYIAIFNFSKDPQTITVDPKTFGLSPNGKLEGMSQEGLVEYDQQISVKLKGYDSIILESV